MFFINFVYFTNLDGLIRDDELVPTIFYSLLNILKQNASLNRIQSLKVLSALLFNKPNIDVIIESLKNIETNDNDEYVI